MTNQEAIRILGQSSDWYSALPDKYTDLNSELNQALWMACNALLAEDVERELAELEGKINEGRDVL